MSEIRTDTINNASGDNDSGIDLSTNDQVIIKTANTTAVTVDANQKVGIGGSPSTPLHVQASGQDANVRIQSSDNGYATRLQLYGNNVSGASFNAIQSYVNGDSTVQWEISGPKASAEDKMLFHTGGTERMRIDNNGKVQMSSDGVADGFLHIKNNFQSDIGMSMNDTSGSGGTAIRFKINGTTYGSIAYSTGGTSYNTSSDHRLKENVTADWDATTRLKQLNPVRFNFIEDADTTVDGFLAHEVQSVVPEAITGTHNEVEVWKDGEELPDGVSVGDNKLDEDGNTIPVYQGIDQSKLVPLLVKTIQELEARIEALENA